MSGREWYSSPDCLEKIKSSIENSGIPLELKSTTIIREKGYFCTQYYYSDQLLPENEDNLRKLRELELYAYKTQDSFNFENCQINFNIRLFLECKHKQNGTYIAFRKSVRNQRIPTLPTTFYGRGMTYPYYNNFIVPITIRKISEFNLNGMKPEGDKTIHEACHQLINACNYNYMRFRKSMEVIYRNIKGTFMRRYPNNTKENILKNLSDIEIINHVQIFPFTLAFCIIVVNHEAGLMEAIYDEENSRVTNVEDVGYGIYPFVSQEADKYENLIENYLEFPIFISDIDNLNECVDVIEGGVSKMSASIEAIINNRPHNLAGLILDENFGND